MGAATHNPNISITVLLSERLVAGADFSIMMLLVPKASNSLNSARTMRFASYEEAQTAQTAGYISTTTLSAIEAAFAQPEAPTYFKVGNVDLVGSETYATGLAAVIEADPDFYALAILPRTDAEIELVSEAVENSSKKMLFFFQSDDSGLLTGTFPSGLTDTQDNERTVCVYHTHDAQYGEVAYAINRLVADPDEIATPWSGCPIDGVDALSPLPTSSQRTYAIDNYANLGLAYGPESYVMDPGVTMSGREIGEIYAADWFSTRLQERVGALVTARAVRHQAIPVDAAGLALLAAEVEALLQQGQTAGHFTSFTVAPQAITSADQTARRLRIVATATVRRTGRVFNFTTYFV